MTGKTHKLIGLATGLAVSKQLGVNIDELSVLVPFSVSLIVGSLLPDIDHAGSTIGKEVPIIPHLIKHRGFTHSIIFILTIYLICLMLNVQQIIILGLLIGVSTHILADMLTPAGVQLLFPIDKRVKIPLISSKYTESILLMFILVFLVYLYRIGIIVIPYF